MLAIVEAYRAGLLNYKNWMPNILSGLIVGVVALPLAMAFAIASGVTPVQGLYTAIIAAVIVSVFGGSRIQIAGPTGAFIVILAGITAHYGISGLQIATFMAGFILLIMGFMRLGSVIKFIPDPVIVGFTSGIGVIIFVGQWKDFFGLHVHIALDASFYQKLVILMTNIPHLNVNSTLLGCLSVFLVLLTPKIIKRIPGPLVSMLVITALQSFFHFSGVATLGSTFGAIPQSLPSFHWPKPSLDECLTLVGPAFTIALLGAIESLLSATAADGMANTRHNSNQELIGQGLANIVSPLFGGFAATGAIARTATNVRNGGNSPLSGIVHSILLLLILIFLAPLANNIPLCSLAAILFVVAYNMSDVPHFIRIIRCAPRYDIFILLITFFLTIFVNLVVAVNIGVILAMLFFMRRMIQSIEVEDMSESVLKDASFTLPKNTLYYRIQGPFFFGAAEKIEHALAVTHTDAKNIIFSLKEVPFIDMTGLETFEEIIEQFHHRNVIIYLCEANALVTQKLQKADILRWVHQEKIYSSFHAVLETVVTK